MSCDVWTTYWDLNRSIYNHILNSAKVRNRFCCWVANYLHSKISYRFLAKSVDKKPRVSIGGIWYLKRKKSIKSPNRNTSILVLYVLPYKIVLLLISTYMNVKLLISVISILYNPVLLLFDDKWRTENAKIHLESNGSMCPHKYARRIAKMLIFFDIWISVRNVCTITYFTSDWILSHCFPLFKSFMPYKGLIWKSRSICRQSR